MSAKGLTRTSGDLCLASPKTSLELLEGLREVKPSRDVMIPSVVVGKYKVRGTKFKGLNEGLTLEQGLRGSRRRSSAVCGSIRHERPAWPIMVLFDVVWMKACVKESRSVK